MESMVFRLIGVTGWTLDAIARLTMPQLELVLRGQGQILYPRLKPQLDAQFGKLRDAPDTEGGESDIDRILREHDQRQGNPDAEPELTPQQWKRQRAYRIQNAAYLPPEDSEQQASSPAAPIEGLPPATARAVLAFGVAGGFPADIWAEDVTPLLRAIKATAAVQ